MKGETTALKRERSEYSLSASGVGVITAREAECDHVALMLAERGEGLYDLTGTSMLGAAQMKLRRICRALS